MYATASVGAESVREALQDAVPPISRPHAQMAHLTALNASFSLILSGNPALNPFLASDQGRTLLNQKRAALLRLCFDHAETLGAPQDAARVPGWNRLMLFWIVICQITLCLDRAGGSRDAGDATCHAALRRDELLMTSALSNVYAFTMRELKVSLDLVRDRLFVSRGGTPLKRLVGALELRAAEFVCGSPGESAFNVPLWVMHEKIGKDMQPTTPRAVTKAFIVTFAWHFLWIRRHLYAWDILSQGDNLRKPGVVGGRICEIPLPVPKTVPREAVMAFLLAESKTVGTSDHRRAFVNLTLPYTVSPGDLDAHSHVHGMSGIERATERDVLMERLSGPATVFCGRERWKCRLEDWVGSFADRCALNPANPAAGGVELMFENLAILYVVNAYFIKRFQVQFLRGFVITNRGAGPDFELRFSQALRNGVPCLVQKLGRWACLVPAPQTCSILELEQRCRLFGDLPQEEPVPPAEGPHSLYDCPDLPTALAVWALLVLEGWGGKIPHAPCSIRPALRAMLGMREE